MRRTSKVVIAKERTIHTYAELWHAADCVLRAGQENPKGSTWQFLSALILTAFSFEAYLNHVGSKTLSNWGDHDWQSPLEKLKLLVEILGLQFETGPGERPRQTLSRLFIFRNAIAHGRTAELAYKPVKRDVDKYQAEFYAPLLADWEKLIQNAEFAVRAREDVEAVMRVVQSGRKDSADNLFSTGIGHDSATLVSDP
jgi:hypothetical protein